MGAAHPQAMTAPRSIEALARKPMMAPTAAISGEKSTTKPRFGKV